MLDRIIEVLKENGQMKAKKIAKMLGLSRPTEVNKILYAYLNRYFVKYEDNTWSLNDETELSSELNVGLGDEKKTELSCFEQYLEDIRESDAICTLIDYIPLNAGVVFPFIRENKDKFQISQLIKHVGILDCYCMWNTGNTQEENVRIFSVAAHAIGKLLGRNERVEMFNQISSYNKNNNFDFPLSLSEVIDIERKLKYAEDGEFSIPWDYVEFRKGYLLLYHPLHPKKDGGTPFRINEPMSETTLNKISLLFKNECKPFKVISKQGKIIKVKNRPDISKYIGFLNQHTHQQELELLQLNKAIRPMPIFITEAKQHIKEKDSKYLTFLSKHHLQMHKAYLCLEVRLNSNLQSSDEEAFMFVLSEGKRRVNVVFENCEPNTASIVFVIEQSRFNDAINEIHRYFASVDIVNKREMLRLHIVPFAKSGIISYHHVNHTDSFYDWKQNISKYL